MDHETIGKRVRTLRKERKVSGKELADLTGFSPAAISKFERGQLRPSEDFLERVITALQLPAQEAWALRELGALFESRFQSWKADEGAIERNQKVIGQREKKSRSIRCFMNQIPHGLLQTESYMRAVFKSIYGDPRPSNMEPAIKARLKRQKLLSQKGRNFVFVLGEAALVTCLGSHDILLTQLEHFQSIIDSSSNVELRVLPFFQPLMRVPMHHFILYDERTVEIELLKGQLDLFSDDDVGHYIELMNYLVANSLSPAGSRELIEAVKDRVKAMSRHSMLVGGVK